MFLPCTLAIHLVLEVSKILGWDPWPERTCKLDNSRTQFLGTHRHTWRKLGRHGNLGRFHWESRMWAKPRLASGDTFGHSVRRVFLSIAQDSLKFTIILPQSLNWWNYGCEIIIPNNKKYISITVLLFLSSKTFFWGKKLSEDSVDWDLGFKIT